MILIKIDCCGHSQTLCGLSVWSLSVAVRAIGLNYRDGVKSIADYLDLLVINTYLGATNKKLDAYMKANNLWIQQYP